MENKKLLSIILKDMSELEELLSEAKNKEEHDALDMEILHLKARSTLLLLRKMYNSPEMQPDVKKNTVNVAGRNTLTVTEPVLIKETDADPDSKIQKEHSISESEIAVSVHHPEISETGNEVPVEKEPKREIPVQETGRVVTGLSENEMELQEEQPDALIQRLGDSFIKERSVNDLVSDHNKLEFKISNRPVVSIQSAIGINDRFQYIRELFDGDGNKFSEVVKTLDSMQHIREAVEYLQHNFKWKKNETSLKFVNLVKRRFPDE